MYPIKQSTSITIPFFAHDVNGDAVPGLVDGGFTKRISKNGAAFGAMTVTITEMENGWYSMTVSSSHSDTLGVLSVTFTHASIKQVNLQLRVHANLPDDLATAAALTTHDGKLDTVDANVDAILVDTGTTLPASIATIDTNVDSILVDTGEIGAAGAGLTDLGGMSTGMKAEVNAECDTAISDYNTSAMTESYAADGAAPTPEQSRFMAWSALSEFAIAGTTITSKKLDGSTTAMTHTLDDATNPTSRTRAT